ncbi:hypothetical protein M2447_002195 [Ereboglobus sp. PH5-10]|uniref:Uncharacterized protein n=1 Tax=Ereboglobus luteus TaxID=1796921 RepID=A0A2U8E418_9BACT|nr:hypothetical protein CKA38_10635 [Ereboglobus luteus]MDF9828082.1 hypothetical protein [Ereboglobus sp. PH5-10]
MRETFLRFFAFMSDNPTSLDDALFATIANGSDAACVTLFIQLLRESPNLRHWLFSAFLNPDTRSRLSRHLSGKTHPPRHSAHGRHLLSWLANTDKALARDAVLLSQNHTTSAPYGGLTHAQVINLIRRYQAGGTKASGGIELSAFLLAHAWRRALPDLSNRAALLLISGRFFQAAFSGHCANLELVQNLVKAAEFFRGQPRGSITRAHFGYTNWWKLSVLHYMLNNPKPRYCIRDFRRHLRTQKIIVETKDVRRFCKKHGILRNSRPGRPSE